MDLSLDQYATQLVASQLVSADELRALVHALPRDKRPRDGQQLARELIRQRRLTSYQATQVYLGKLQNLSLGNYRILDKLGQGGMGLVLKAEHKLLKRMVAIKVLSPGVTKKPGAMERFQREVEAAAKLSHPNIVAAYDADEDNETRFLVLEYVEGIDLAEVVQKQGPLPVELALNYLHQVARGLEYAHQQGVIHRDIKPSNLLLDQHGIVRVLDMGLARLAEDPAPFSARQAELTDTGIIMGTVDYMSPEQAENTKKADPRSDLYSLGICFYYFLTGQNAYGGETLMERLIAHREWPIPSIRALRGDVCEEVEALFRKMVAKKPADRFQSMKELIAALAHCMVGEVEQRTTGVRSAGHSDDAWQFVPPPLPSDHPARSTVAERVEFDWSPTPSAQILPPRKKPSSAISRFTFAQLKQPKVMLSGAVTLILVCLVGWSWIGNSGIASSTRRLKIPNKDATNQAAGAASNTVVPGQSNQRLNDRDVAGWVLGGRGTVQIEDDSGQRLTLDRGREIPRGPFMIREISLVSGDIQDRDIEALNGLRGLESLTLPDSRQITDACLLSLVQLERLATLRVPGTGITVAGLSSLPQLRELGLDAAQFNVGKIAGSNFPELRRLNLIGLKEVELQHLLQLSIPVESLVLTNAEGSHRTWSQLFAHFSELTEIQINDSDISDNDVVYLARCRQLAKVTLMRTGITDYGLRELARVKTLKYLNVRNTQVTRIGVQKFRQIVPQCKVEA